MKSSRNYPAMQFKVGTLLAVALAVTLLALIFPTKGVNPFSRKFKLITYFPEVSGLRTSSPVWFSGVEVGSVAYVDFVPGSNPPQLKVVMNVERKIQIYLKTDSKAVIKGMGLLGDMYVELTPGSATKAGVENGDVIAGVAPEDTKQVLDQMTASAKSLLNNLNRITSDLAEGQGTLGLLLKDPSLYGSMQESVNGLKNLLASLNQPDGSLQKLMKDPALYNEVVATVRDVHTVVDDLKQAEQKVLTPQTKEALDETIKTATKVVKRVGEIEEKLEQIRFDFTFGAEKYTDTISDGHADLLIWPNKQRYYQAGIQKVSRLYGQEKDQTTFDAQLAWRILDSPLFIRGGIIKNDYFVAGLDLRLFDDDFKVLLDTYRIELNPVQVDVRTGLMFLNFLEVTAGAEDIMRTPFYKAGLTIHYRDDDLLNVLFKVKF